VAAPGLSGVPRFTVVVPTRGRRDLVLRLVTLLDEQTYRDFEAVVVVDGALDGTAAALRAVETRFPLTVVEQEHRGVAEARNAGAAAARGEIVLFLDDDMAPDDALLAEHDRSHGNGAQLVVGHMPLDPASPSTPLSAAIGRWAERRRSRLADLAGDVPATDLITGQMSVGREDFNRLGGFDVSFTRGGLVPGADRDFGFRARRAGLRTAFNPAAVTYQHYDIDVREHLRRARAGARGDRVLAARYPELADELWTPTFDTLPARLILSRLAALPPIVSAPLRAVACRLFERPDAGAWSSRLFFAVRTMERRRGAREGERGLRIADRQARRNDDPRWRATS
jgi:glycosyltransferase involved in cell wall biosynthesis